MAQPTPAPKLLEKNVVLHLREDYVRRLLNAEHALAADRRKVLDSESLVEQLQGAIQACDRISSLPDFKPVKPAEDAPPAVTPAAPAASA